MNLILVGLLCILFRYDYSFFSENIGAIVTIDVFPDFVGYMLIWFGLEKASGVNRWFKECHTISTAMLVVTFLSFLSSVSFLLGPLLQTPDGKIYGVAFSLITLAVSSADKIIYAVTMIFAFMLASALGYSMQTQEKNFPCVLMYIFSIAYTVFAIAYAVTQFISIPIELWWFAYPVNALFMLSAYFIMGKVEELK